MDRPASPVLGLWGTEELDVKLLSPLFVKHTATSIPALQRRPGTALAFNA